MNENRGTIIYIGGFEMPDKNAAAHRVINNSRIFRDLGYHVVFCGVDRDNVKAAKIDVFDNHPLPYPRNGLEWFKYLIDFSYIKNMLIQYKDIQYVIAYNLHAIPLLRLLAYCKMRKIKVIADVTEWYENKFSFNPLKLIKFIDTTLVMQLIHKKVDGIISISSYLEKYYSNYVKNIIILPPLVDISEEKWRVKLTKNDDCIEFVYAGSPGYDKDNIGLIVNCFSKIETDNKVKLKILGLDRQQFGDLYPQYITSLETLGDKVSFMGRVSHRESISALSQSDYCIFIRERNRKNMAGFPTKFVECITSGTGIIANDISDIRQYFPSDGRSILLNDIDEASICKALQHVINKATVCKLEDKLINRVFDYHAYKEEVYNFLSKL